MKIVSVLFVFLSILIGNGDAYPYRILGVFPGPSYSHHALGNRLMKALAEKGHDVTMISAFKENDPPKNYTKIDLEGIVEKVEVGRRNMFNKLGASPFKLLWETNDLGVLLVQETLSNSNVQELLQNRNKTFNVIIMEQFVADALKVLSYHYKCPLIAFSTIGSGHSVNELVGNPAPRSYVVDVLLSYDGARKMNYFQRLHNLFMGIFEQFNDYFFYFPSMNRLIQQYYPGAPTVQELNANVSLVFLNSHVSTNQPVPHVPNMIEIGGFHIHPQKRLPKDLSDFLNNATEGVVYFNMGSFLNSKDLPKEIRATILKVFSQLKQKVLWKFEEDLPGAPANVKIAQWLPQQNILAHPNVKVFITHGGMLSTIEAVYFGVPMLGIPVCGDQGLNIAKAVAGGFAVQLDFNDLTEKSFGNALNEILNNRKYKDNALRRAWILRDQPMKPLDSAIFWTEYVIRHNGAKYFRSAALDLNWFEYYFVDFMIVIVVLNVIITYKLGSILFNIIKRKLRKEGIKEKIHVL